MHREFPRWGLALVLFIGLLLRVGFVAYTCQDAFRGGQLRDPDDYGRLAVNMVRSGTFGYPINPASESPDNSDSGSAKAPNATGSMRPTAYRPPLYPAMLTAAVIPDIVRGVALHKVELSPGVVLGLHVLLGLVTIGLVYYIAWRVDCRWCWLPALAVAADPILLHWSSEMMTETLITLLAVWAWALYLMLVRPNMGEVGRRILGMRTSLRVSLVLGTVLGMAVLTRPTMLPWAVLMIASLSLRGNDAGNRVSMITAALVVMTIINAGWTFRNKQQLGKPIWTTTHGGYTLLLANNPPLYKHFREAGPSRDWDADQFHKRWAMRRSGDPTDIKFWEVELPTVPIKSPDIDELKDDRLAQEAAIATIKADPYLFVISCLYRASWLWSITPNLNEDSDRQAESETGAGSGVPARSKLPQSKLDGAEIKRWLIGSWYVVWFAMALGGVLWLREALTSRVWWMPILLVLTLTAIHAVYWSNMRMRAPMMPVVYMVACWPLMRARTPSRLS